MSLPAADTPLYNHPLPDIETWLSQQGCEQDPEEPHCWYVKKTYWQADLILDIDSLVVRYINGWGKGARICSGSSNIPSAVRIWKKRFSPALRIED